MPAASSSAGEASDGVECREVCQSAEYFDSGGNVETRWCAFAWCNNNTGDRSTPPRMSVSGEVHAPKGTTSSSGRNSDRRSPAFPVQSTTVNAREAEMQPCPSRHPSGTQGVPRSAGVSSDDNRADAEKQRHVRTEALFLPRAPSDGVGTVCQHTLLSPNQNRPRCRPEEFQETDLRCPAVVERSGCFLAAAGVKTGPPECVSRVATRRWSAKPCPQSMPGAVSADSDAAGVEKRVASVGDGLRTSIKQTAEVLQSPSLLRDFPPEASCTVESSLTSTTERTVGLQSPALLPQQSASSVPDRQCAGRSLDWVTHRDFLATRGPSSSSSSSSLDWTLCSPRSSASLHREAGGCVWGLTAASPATLLGCGSDPTLRSDTCTVTSPGQATGSTAAGRAVCGRLSSDPCCLPCSGLGDASRCAVSPLPDSPTCDRTAVSRSVSVAWDGAPSSSSQSHPLRLTAKQNLNCFISASLGSRSPPCAAPASKSASCPAPLSNLAVRNSASIPVHGSVATNLLPRRSISTPCAETGLQCSPMSLGPDPALCARASRSFSTLAPTLRTLHSSSTESVDSGVHCVVLGSTSSAPVPAPFTAPKTAPGSRSVSVLVQGPPGNQLDACPPAPSSIPATPDSAAAASWTSVLLPGAEGNQFRFRSEPAECSWTGVRHVPGMSSAPQRLELSSPCTPQHRSQSSSSMDSVDSGVWSPGPILSPSPVDSPFSPGGTTFPSISDHLPAGFVFRQPAQPASSALPSPPRLSCCGQPLDSSSTSGAVARLPVFGEPVDTAIPTTSPFPLPPPAFRLPADTIPSTTTIPSTPTIPSTTTMPSTTTIPSISIIPSTPTSSLPLPAFVATTAVTTRPLSSSNSIAGATSPAGVPRPRSSATLAAGQIVHPGSFTTSGPHPSSVGRQQVAGESIPAGSSSSSSPSSFSATPEQPSSSRQPMEVAPVDSVSSSSSSSATPQQPSSSRQPMEMAPVDSVSSSPPTVPQQPPPPQPSSSSSSSSSSITTSTTSSSISSTPTTNPTTTTTTTTRAVPQDLAASAQCLTDYSRLERSMRALGDACIYYPDLDSDGARALLQDCPLGTFLVRDSSDSRFLFAISLKTERGPTSVRIRYDRGLFQMDCENQAKRALPRFETILELLDFHMAVSRQREGFQYRWLEASRRRDLSVRLAAARRHSPPSLTHLARVTVNRSLGDLHLPVRSTDLLSVPVSVKQFLRDYPYRV